MKDNLTPLGLGTSTIASLGSSLSFNSARNLFDAALDLNIRTVDTSNTYGSGDAERLIGKVIKHKRNNYFITSKVGLPYLSLPKFLSPLNQIGKKIFQNLIIKKCYKKEYILNNIEKSLRRLKINNLDGYLLHNMLLKDFYEYKDECFEALYLIKKKGLSKFVGISSNDYELFNKNLENINIDLVQTNMIFKKKNTELLGELKKRGNKLIVNSIFSKKIDANLDFKINQIIEKFGIPRDDKKSILINYCIKKNEVDCALFRTTNINHLKIIGKSYFKYEGNFSELFNELDHLFL